MCPKLLVPRTFAAVLWCGLSSSVVAQTTTWTGAAGSAWNVAANWSAGVPTASANAVVPAGTPNAPATAGAASPACATLVFNAGATLSVSSGDTLAVGGTTTINGTLQQDGTTTVGGNLSGSGAALGGGTISLVGSGTTTFGGLVGTTCLLQVAKSGGGFAQMNAPTTCGGLLLTGGNLQVSFGGTHTLTVNGNATFSGGALSFSFVGTIAVNGNVTFSGTSCVNAPNFTFTGDWTGGPGFAPTNGTATPLGTTTQTLGGGATFFNFAVQSGTSPVLAGAATVNGILTVNGTLTNSATLSVAGSALTGSGAALGAGTIAFVGSGTTSFGGLAASTCVLQVAKTGAAQALLTSPLTVGGLVLTSGALVVSQGGAYALTVDGDATFAGGTLQTSFVGTIAIAGSATFSGTTGANPPTIVCAGNWTGHPAFAPTTGTVTLNGVQPQQILASSKFNALTVAAGAVVGAGVDLTVEATTVTVNAGGTLAADARRLAFHRPAGATTLTVNGVLSASAGGALAFGPQTTTTVGVSGALSLVGVPDNRAKMTHESAPGYTATVNGTIAAMNFVVESVGANGLVIPTTATIAAAPHDLRNGIFDRPLSPTACLLNVQRATPTNFRYLAFENSNGVVASNVRCLGGAAVSFTNWSGALAGEAFDDDGAANRATWNAPEATSLAFLFAVPGVSKATVVFRLGTVVDVAEFSLERSDAGGPYAAVFQTQPNGAGPYAFVDDPLSALTTYDYRLYQRLTHGEVVLLGQTSATPFIAAPPANVLEVGPGGTTTDLQAAISAAVAAGGQITALRVAPGTYGSFTLTGAPPSGLKIFADGPGAAIDTTNGPVAIRDLPSGSPVELRGFAIGSATSGHEGLVIENCSAPVLVDEVDVAGGAGLPAIRIATAFAGASVSRFTATGSPGVRVQQSSTAALSAGVVATVELATASYVQDCGLGAAVFANDGSCVRESYAGAAPTFDAPSFASIGTPISFAFQGAPLQYWALIGGFVVEYVPYPQSAIQMPQLLGVQAAFLVSEQFADGTGAGQFQSILPPSPAVLGIALTWQVVALDPSPAYRLSHAVSTIPVL